MMWSALDHDWLTSIYMSFFIILIQVYPKFICPKKKTDVRIWAFQSKSNLSFLYLSVSSGLYPVVNAPYSHSWRRLLIVDRCLLGLSRCLEEVFLHQEKDSAISNFSCLQWTFDVVELTGALFLLKNLPTCWFSHSWSFLLCRLFSAYRGLFTCTDISSDFILIAPAKQLPNDNSAFKINPRPFLCFICLEVMSESTKPRHEPACQSVVQIPLSSWKWTHFA